MTRKNYEAIAEAIRTSDEAWDKQVDSAYDRSYNYGCGWENGYYIASEYIVQKLISVFEEDNPRFDKERFLRACGL